MYLYKDQIYHHFLSSYEVQKHSFFFYLSKSIVFLLYVFITENIEITLQEMNVINNPKQRKLLDYIDILVDGKFVLEEKSLDIYFRGSRNQRIIDVKKSLEEESVVLVEEYRDDKDYSLNYKKPEYLFI